MSTVTERTSGNRLTWVLAVVGLAALFVVTLLHPSAARSAAAQVWPPFVLVSGQLLVGLVANDDGLFAAAGHRLAQTSPNGISLFIGATVTVGGVTAVLNLDTSVAFLTPVLVYTARSRAKAKPRFCADVCSSPTRDPSSFLART